MAYSSAKDPLLSAAHFTGKAAMEKARAGFEGRTHMCGECGNYVESPFTEGNGICVLENSEGRVSQIEFTQKSTRCFTGRFERSDDE